MWITPTCCWSACVCIAMALSYQWCKLYVCCICVYCVLLSVLMVVVVSIHAVELCQGPEPGPPVAEKVIIQVWTSRGTSQRAEASGQRLGSLVAVDVERVVREPVSVVIGFVFLYLNHRCHVALAGGGLSGLLDHGVERRVGAGILVAKQGAIVASRSEDWDIVAKRKGRRTGIWLCTLTYILQST